MNMNEPFVPEQTRPRPFSDFFRLLILIYLLLYMFPFPLSEIPLLGDLLSYYSMGIEALSLWLGHHLLHMSTLEKIQFTGSGDTHLDYVNLLTFSLLALVLSILIFALTRKRTSYRKLEDFARVYARYYLGLTLLTYGLIKMYEGQFPFPSLSRLEQPIGNSSPMGLLWTFMGYSKSFTMFSGICEIAAGFLFLFRRTAVLGGLLSLAVMANVVMMNFAYDVPVKLFSSHLLLITVFILAPNLRDLYRFFILNIPAKLHFKVFKKDRKAVRWTRLAAKLIVVLGFPVYALYSDLDQREQPKHALSAAYYTTQFIRNTDTLQPLATDSTRWSKMILDRNRVKIVMMNEKSTRYDAAVDTVAHFITLTSDEDSSKRFQLKYRQLSDSNLLVSGAFDKDSITGTFRIRRITDYPLTKRGFNWINDYPYNR